MPRQQGGDHSERNVQQSDLYVGLMSGTSMDGVDAVLVDFSANHPRMLAHVHHDFAPELRKELMRLNTPGADELHRASVASQHLARSYAWAVDDLLLHAEIDAGQIRALGAHGQTVRHRPEAGYTIQLNAPAALAELARIDVVADFRSRDIAAGGQGAPLVPGLHASVFTSAQARAVINIGGISNLTGLPGEDGATPVIGFDCGPGNVLIDAWALEHLGEPFDRDGRWAAGGQVNAALLAALLAEPYLALPPPKSTGRDLFNVDWLRSKLGAVHERIDPHDVIATLTRLTATVIGDALKAHFPQAEDVIVCGGGARNATLMAMLADEVAPRAVRSSEALGVAPEHVEAIAFAWLARAFFERRAGNLPSVTGAEGERVLGALYPAR
jgi:anhydro-N-acetylmuramic acid kinase